MIEEVVGVVGFPRSGTSLVMQMIHASGFPTVGTWPAFEDVPSDRIYRALPRCAGKAIKILDVAQMEAYRPAGVPLRSILLRRASVEQSKSFAKFARVTMGIRMSRQDVEGIRASFKRDFPRLERWCIDQGPTLCLDFERLIVDPLGEARVLASWIGRPDCVEPMAAQVTKRVPGCFPGMLELEQLRAGGPPGLTMAGAKR